MQVKMTQAEFNRVAARAQAQGVNLSAPSGMIEKMGVKASYVYDGEMLTVEVLDKPFLLSKDFVEGKLRELLGESGQ